MKKSHLTLLFLLNISFLFGQKKNCECIDELDIISNEITNSRSYRIQIKRKNREEELLKWKEKIKEEIRQDNLRELFCVGYLQKYISLIKDKHNQIYHVPKEIPSDFPIYTKEQDQDQKILDSISGIYHAGTETIFLERDTDSLWRGILLESDNKIWKKGHLRMRLKKLPNGHFELFEFFPNGMLYYQNNIDISNGRIHSTFWNKENNYFFNIHQEEVFSYKTINSTFDYIGIKTLSRTRKLMKQAGEFYDTRLPRLQKENLIIDLRNNGGGAVLQAKPLLKFLKKNTDIHTIYVMINFKTGSAAELTALKLAQDKRSILVGENSSGMLSYGYGNKSYSGTTDCSDYKFSFTTKRKNQEFHQYEYVGITPDLYLNNNSDWIEQLIELNLP